MTKLTEVPLKGGLAKILKDKKTMTVITVVGLIGILLIFLSSFFDGGSKETSENVYGSLISTQEYTENLEKKLKEIVTSIDGVGTAHVMITLETSVEYVYAKDSKSNTNQTNDGASDSSDKSTDQRSSEKNVVIVDGQNGRQALIQTQKEPVVKGVVVSCEGAGNAKVQEDVTNAVMTALGIRSTRVSVVKAAGNRP